MFSLTGSVFTAAVSGTLVVFFMKDCPAMSVSEECRFETSRSGFPRGIASTNLLIGPEDFAQTFGNEPYLGAFRVRFFMALSRFFMALYAFLWHCKITGKKK